MASLETRAMFAEQMVAGQVYRNDLAHRLREIGYGIEFDPRSGLFEIKGVPEALIDSFSQRSEQIDAHAREHGLEGQAGRQRSFYATRTKKVKVSRYEMEQRWLERSQVHSKALDQIRRSAEQHGDQTALPKRPWSQGPCSWHQTERDPRSGQQSGPHAAHRSCQRGW
jgi:hypothetical protein